MHPRLRAKLEALQYIEKLIIELIHTICNAKPVSIQDVKDQVGDLYDYLATRTPFNDFDSMCDKSEQKICTHSYSSDT